MSVGHWRDDTDRRKMKYSQGKKKNRPSATVFAASLHGLILGDRSRCLRHDTVILRRNFEGTLRMEKEVVVGC
jgi:hypothetical protein